MTLNFEKYTHTGNTFIKAIAKELGDKDDRDTAGRILCSTLHVLRDQSSPEESIQFISQLPMFIKAIYVDGWKPGSNKGRVRHLDDFISAVQEQGHTDDFTDEEDCFFAIKAVFRVIKDYVSEGEIEDLRRTIPEELKTLLD